MSFPIHTETYMIGKRRYRRNPYVGSKSGKPASGVAPGAGDTADLYDDGDELDDGPSCVIAERTIEVEESLTRSSPSPIAADAASSSSTSTQAKKPKLAAGPPPGFENIVQKNILLAKEPADSRVSYDEQAQKWSATAYVPSGLMGLFLGTGKRRLKELEESTNCRVVTPARDSDSPVRITSTIGEENVSRCLDRIEIFVTKNRATAAFTHFAAIPMRHDDVLECYSQFVEIAKDLSGVDDEHFMDPKKLHLTLCMMRILDKKDEQTAITVFEEAVKEATKELKGERLVVDVQGLSIMNDDPTSTAILYANVQSDALKPFAEALRKGLQKSDLAEKGELKLHLSLIRTKPYEKRRVTFDATKLLDEHKEFYFGTVVIDHVVLVSRTAQDSDGFYKRIHRLDI